MDSRQHRLHNYFLSDSKPGGTQGNVGFLISLCGEPTHRAGCPVPQVSICITP